MALKLKFTEEQLRELRSMKRPKLDADGQPVLSRGIVTLEDSPHGTAWRFVDGNSGAPKERVYHLADTGMADRQLSLVAFTRTKSAYKLYGADADLDPGFLGERMGTDRMKANALEARKPPGPTLRDPSFRERAAHAWQQVVNRIRGKHQAPKRTQQRVKIGMS